MKSTTTRHYHTRRISSGVTPVRQHLMSYKVGQKVPSTVRPLLKRPSLNPTSKGVKTVIDNVLESIRNDDKRMEKEVDESIGEKFDESKWKDPLADVMVYSDKDMITRHGEFGYSPELIEKKSTSNTLAIITYDGAGYDYFSREGEIGWTGRTPPALGLLEKKLKQKYGDKVMVEPYTNWALGVYKQ
jgi:hypothetical protein